MTFLLKAKLTIFIAVCIVAAAVSAIDVQKYGATFEAAADGITNDFAYAVGDYIGIVFTPPTCPYYSYHTNVGTYRGVSEGEPYGWFAGSEDDWSEIIARTDAAGGQSLLLETDAEILTNKLEKGVADEINTAIANESAYFELEAKLVVSDVLDAGVSEGFHRVESGTPKSIVTFFTSHNETLLMLDSGSAAKFAIYAYCNDDNEHSPTNLVVFHAVMDASGGVTYTNEVFSSVHIDTTRYTKLRVEMKRIENPTASGDRYNVFSVITDDGSALSSLTALDARFYGTATGTWFMTTEDRSDADNMRVSSLNFKGMGEIDNINIGVIQAASSSGDFAAGETVEGATISADMASWLNARKGGMTREAFLAALDDDGYSLAQEYLLNTDPKVPTTVDFRIGGISIGDKVGLQIALVRTENGSTVESPIIGTLKIQGATQAIGPYSDIDTLTNKFNGATNAEKSLTTAYKFFKAVIAE